jgi:membrane-associated protease RseP (regulator of RpoE activity)
LDRKTYTLIGEDDEHAQARMEKIAGGTQGVSLKLDAGLPLAGIVRNADDEPVGAYTLLVTKRQGLVREVVTTRSVIDPRGRFDIRVPKGSYELIASATGWSPGTPLPVDAGTTDVKIKLSAGATLLGVVVDATTGKPMEYARVTREGASGGATAMAANAGVVTRADGTFELAGIPAGPFTISIGAGEHHPKLAGGLVAQDGQTIGPMKFELAKLKEGEEPRIDLVGIGVKLAAEGEALKVEMVAPESGAAAAGIVAGDLLVAVDGVPVTQLGIDGSVARIRGVAGTKLSVGVKRGEQRELGGAGDRRVHAAGLAEVMLGVARHRRVEHDTADQAYALAFDQDAFHVAVGARDGTVRERDLRSIDANATCVVYYIERHHPARRLDAKRRGELGTVEDVGRGVERDAFLARDERLDRLAVALDPADHARELAIDELIDVDDASLAENSACSALRTAP